MPLLAVVLLVQIFAPIGAVCFIAHAMADPVGVAPLCAAMAQADTPDGVPVSHGGSCCVVCSLSLGGAPVPALPPQDFVVARFAKTVAWQLADSAPISLRSFAHAQARGPPVLLPASA
ncbi:hypothetical protein [Rhodopseudomonas palustris]|nr:hypothetical protein [Rhodopseudomonas palustris]